MFEAPRIRSYCSLGLAGVGTAVVPNVEFAVPIIVEVVAGALGRRTLNRRLSDLEEISGSAIIEAATSFHVTGFGCRPHH
jgi:hypothetical protein